MRGLGRRLGNLERSARAREAALGPAILVVSPDGWPAADRGAYDRAGEAGDGEAGVGAARAALVAKHAGRAPGPATTVIELRERADGPA